MTAQPPFPRVPPGNWLAPDGERLDEQAHDDRPLVPFSEGPGLLPGPGPGAGHDEHLARGAVGRARRRAAPLLAGHDVVLRHRDARLDRARLPASLSPFATAFTLTARA